MSDDKIVYGDREVIFEPTYLSDENQKRIKDMWAEIIKNRPHATVYFSNEKETYHTLNTDESRASETG